MMGSLKKVRDLIDKRPFGAGLSLEQAEELKNAMADAGKSFVLHFGSENGKKKDAPVWICSWKIGKKKFKGYDPSISAEAIHMAADSAAHYVTRLLKKKQDKKKKK